uniref:Uncharacterized protein n=1 Tax=Panagrolaimus sp. ES5 TaxID=591445 RepID=A0AC34FRE0_9BILA
MIIDEHQNIIVNEKDIRDDLRLIDLTKYLGSASYCGAKKEALLLSYYGKGYAKARSYGNVRDIFKA